MSRRGPSNRGRHRKARSPETLRFEQLAAPPPAPSWLEPERYRQLVRLRQRLELDDDRT